MTTTTVHTTRISFSRNVITVLGAPAAALDVLAAASDGATTKDVAGRLHLSEHTVRTNLSSAIAKTGTRTRAEAYALAQRNGWL